MDVELSKMDKSDKILNELKEIKKDLNQLKSGYIDNDVVLSKNDLKAIKEAEKDIKNNRLTSVEELEQELGL